MSNALVGALGTKQVNTAACRKQQCKKTNSRPSLRGWDVVLGWGLVGLILPKFKFSYVPAYRKKKKRKKLLTIPITIACAEPKWEKYQGLAQ